MIAKALAASILDQQRLSLVQQQALVEKHQAALFDMKEVDLSKVVDEYGLSGTGVYFNDLEVPQAMHVQCSSRFVSQIPCLPAGKPMPQRPKLVSNKGPIANGIPPPGVVSEDHRDDLFSCRSIKRDCLYSEEGRSSKRARSESRVPKTLKSDQEDFLEAAITLAEVRNTGISQVTPTTSPKPGVQTALPPPPFSLKISPMPQAANSA